MAAVSLFWSTNMAAVTSGENALLLVDVAVVDRHVKSLIYNLEKLYVHY